MSPRDQLTERVRALPREPGVYLFQDAAGEVIYVGKAKCLRDRVRSYFQARGDGRPAVRFIEEQVADVEVLVTRSEKEAFLLENNLIKKLQPRFNIRLKDDKSYLHLKLDRRHPFPALVPVRRPRKDGHTYFGPYSSARAIRTTLRMLRGIFLLRDCSDAELANRTRPCLKYQIGTCSAPCVGYISEADYAAALEGAVQVLRGDTSAVAGRLRADMDQASADLEFERAAMLRDRLGFLQASTGRQAVELRQGKDQDVVGMVRRGTQVEISVLQFREGKLLSAEPFSFDTDLPDEEALSMFLAQYFHPRRPIPDEVLLAVDAHEREALQAVLEERRGRPVKVRVPRSGEGRRSVEMAARNAALSLDAGQEQRTLGERILEEVRDRLALPDLPRRVECVDVSHTRGSQAVASLVRFQDGEADRAGTRRYRLRETGPGDDYGAMREVVRRRFRAGGQTAAPPDLFLVDGGRGQVAAVRAVLEELGQGDLVVAGMVKPSRRGRGLHLAGDEERIVLAGRPDPVRLPPESEACYFLQRIRDEAHRVAIQYHRSLRSRDQKAGLLEDVPGLGPAKARRVLKHFGGLRELKAASREQLATLEGIGPTLASRIHAHLHPLDRV